MMQRTLKLLFKSKWLFMFYMTCHLMWLLRNRWRWWKTKVRSASLTCSRLKTNVARFTRIVENEIFGKFSNHCGVTWKGERDLHFRKLSSTLGADMPNYLWLSHKTEFPREYFFESFYFTPHCLKITKNVAFEFLNFGIFHQFLSF